MAKRRTQEKSVGENQGRKEDTRIKGKTVRRTQGSHKNRRKSRNGLRIEGHEEIGRELSNEERT